MKRHAAIGFLGGVALSALSIAVTKDRRQSPPQPQNQPAAAAAVAVPADHTFSQDLATRRWARWHSDAGVDAAPRPVR